MPMMPFNYLYLIIYFYISGLSKLHDLTSGVLGTLLGMTVVLLIAVTIINYRKKDRKHIPF